MEPLLDSKSYQKIVFFIEKDLQELSDDTNALSNVFVPVVGHLQFYPRSSQEARVLEEQLSLLQEQMTEAIAILNTLTAIARLKEEDKEKLLIYPLLEENMKLQVKQFVTYYTPRLKEDDFDRNGHTMDSKEENLLR